MQLHMSALPGLTSDADAMVALAKYVSEDTHAQMTHAQMTSSLKQHAAAQTTPYSVLLRQQLLKLRTT